ncbi:unnamed protein product [Calypogeia fissa]
MKPLEVIQLEGIQEEEFEETKTHEEEPIAVLPEQDREQDTENKPVTTTPMVKVGVPEEQQDTEELGFLANTQDTGTGFELSQTCGNFVIERFSLSDLWKFVIERFS